MKSTPERLRNLLGKTLTSVQWGDGGFELGFEGETLQFRATPVGHENSSVYVIFSDGDEVLT